VEDKHKFYFAARRIFLSSLFHDFKHFFVMKIANS